MFYLTCYYSSLLDGIRILLIYSQYNNVLHCLSPVFNIAMQFRKVFDAFCNSKGIDDSNKYKFLFDGEHILNDHTPKMVR